MDQVSYDLDATILDSIPELCTPWGTPFPHATSSTPLYMRPYYSSWPESTFHRNPVATRDDSSSKFLESCCFGSSVPCPDVASTSIITPSPPGNESEKKEKKQI